MTLHAIMSPDFDPDAAAVAVFLHGFGSNEADLAALAQVLPAGMPWASLRAPIAVGPMGFAWFPIVTPGNPDPVPLAAATDAVWAWVEATLSPSTRVVPIGFSQGGLMASQLLRTMPERVLAPVVLGGFVQAAAQSADDAVETSRPTLFWGRGADDRVITADAVARTASWLPSHTTLTERVYPGLGHGIDQRMLADVRDFLADTV